MAAASQPAGMEISPKFAPIGLPACPCGAAGRGAARASGSSGARPLERPSGTLERTAWPQLKQSVAASPQARAGPPPRCDSNQFGGPRQLGSPHMPRGRGGGQRKVRRRGALFPCASASGPARGPQSSRAPDVRAPLVFSARFERLRLIGAVPKSRPRLRQWRTPLVSAHLKFRLRRGRPQSANWQTAAQPRPPPRLGGAQVAGGVSNGLAVFVCAAATLA